LESKGFTTLYIPQLLKRQPINGESIHAKIQSKTLTKLNWIKESFML